MFRLVVRDWSSDVCSSDLRLWIESILNDTDPVVKPEEALVVTEILEAIYKSAQTGEAVYFNQTTPANVTA
jgi:predicted dehydrogenase